MRTGEELYRVRRRGVEARRWLVAVLLLVAAWGVCVAAAPGWVGTWTLDRTQSHLVGPSMTILAVPGGYRFDFGAVAFTIGEDAKEYPTVPTRTTILKRTGPNTWYRVHKTNGVEVDHGTVTVSADGKTMLIHTVATEPNGTVHETDEVQDRVGEGTGLAGTWRSRKAGVNVTVRFTVEDAGGGRLRWSYPYEGQFYVTALDGMPVPYGGKQAVPGITMTLRAVSATELRWTESANGKPLTEGSDVLVEGGRVLRETSWPVARPMDRQDAVYRRQ